MTYQMLEMMVGLRLDVVHTLLEHCSSVKVKRLFLHMVEKLGYSWFEPDGVYDSKYRISLR
jgi:hypothetical protein